MNPEAKTSKPSRIAASSFRFLTSLFLEPKEGRPGLSLGRVFLTCLLAQAMWLWHHSTPTQPASIPGDMKEVLFVMCGYVFGSKGLMALRDYLVARQQAGSQL